MIDCRHRRGSGGRFTGETGIEHDDVGTRPGPGELPRPERCPSTGTAVFSIGWFARIGFARIGLAPHRVARIGFARIGFARIGFARIGSAKRPDRTSS